jgi:Leucine-rich repeat (LRR) protein
LVAFPKELLQMTHLRVINLENNEIVELPSAINQLINLRELSVANNKIHTLPLSIVDLQALKTLILDGNPLRTPPPEIVKQGIKGIFGYLKNLAEGSQQCFRLKLMIVGQGDFFFFSTLFCFFSSTSTTKIAENIGKTTMLRTLRGIKSKEDTISTDGIDIGDWNLKVQFKDENGHKKKEVVQISAWDFAGQELCV